MYSLENEISLIVNQEIKDFVKKCITVVPSYFWKIPSSSTGKHHPEDEHGDGGEVLHTKRVVKISDDLCRNFNVVGNDRDCVIAAAIMHDFVKNGFPDNQNRTVPGHGALWINVVDKFMKQYEVLNSPFIPIIGRIIANHMGRWDIPFVIANNELDLIVQIADYVSSREYIKIDVEKGDSGWKT